MYTRVPWCFDALFQRDDKGNLAFADLRYVEEVKSVLAHKSLLPQNAYSGYILSIYPLRDSCGRKKKCARTDTVFFPISEVSKCTFSLLLTMYYETRQGSPVSSNQGTDTDTNLKK